MKGTFNEVIVLNFQDVNSEDSQRGWPPWYDIEDYSQKFRVIGFPVLPVSLGVDKEKAAR